MRTQTKVAFGLGVAAPIAATLVAAAAYRHEHAEIICTNLRQNEDEPLLRADPRTNDCLEAIRAASPRG